MCVTKNITITNDTGRLSKDDVERMVKLTIESGYQGWVCIEYEGPNPSNNEIEGIQMSKKLLEELWAKHS